MHLRIGHLANAFIQSDLQEVHLSEEAVSNFAVQHACLGSHIYYCLSPR